jgi:hypothetical protein
MMDSGYGRRLQMMAPERNLELQIAEIEKQPCA